MHTRVDLYGLTTIRRTFTLRRVPLIRQLCRNVYDFISCQTRQSELMTKH